MWIITHRRWFFWCSAVLVVGSIAAIALWGIRLGIDFTGGSLLEARFAGSVPDARAIEDALRPIVDPVSVQVSGSDEVLLRFRDVDEATHQEVLGALGELSSIEELRFDSIGPAIGAELRSRGAVAIALGLFAIAVYIGWAFRRASRPVASWQYGAVTAGVALFHDVLIPLGFFAVMGRFAGMEANTPFIAALLTVLGFSVHDTIVVFDRVRENLRRAGNLSFDEVVGQSVRQTFARSLNTSLTVLFAIAAVGYFGGEAVRPFSVTVFIGIAAGTYSSIFIASTALVELARGTAARGAPGRR
ncbi:MAG: protein-export membrane protein SecF [Candidatus Terrybacteria bacterium RIFCSPLOWO2_01_FULL_58_14]|uniref:Protein-export membrane protein SecF n=2 Tax=Candidatus Terryibacteriota TaxID=1817920 RepID=A0A1G2Q098_9BACT|nr:MAG: protein-export membrane protein SecF [Candidatus Terrybacteria bacterium RIFCSPHIGHO2_01_FULL_58_15]OHA53983.1 MAG: protein-export membrane protein SecF [Candidatus Terrybacteria bacterium RIFCSPLOWO2_01_FULL_58_14]